MESPSKSLSHGRRLSELLEQEQEPFLLEIYLSENGYSCKLLKSQQDSMKCWQTGICWKFPGFNKRRGGRMWSSVLPKIWQGKLRKPLKIETRVPVNGSRCILSCFTAVGNEAKANRFSRLLHSCEEVLECRRNWKTMEDSKQLSPVSVFELHSDEGCSAQNHLEEDNPSTSTLNSEQCEESHSSSTFIDLKKYKNSRNDMHQSKQLLLQYSKEFAERICGSHEGLSHDKAVRAMEMQFCSLNVARISELIDVDVFRTRQGWKRFQAETVEIGFKIECFIFDEIREEVVVEMLGSLLL